MSFLCLALLRRASFWPPSMVYILSHHYTYITNYSSSWSWDSMQSSATTSTMYQSAHVESRLYAVFKFEFNHLLIFIEKFSPLPGLEPGTSQVPNRYATNWAILAWIPFNMSVWKKTSGRVYVWFYLYLKHQLLNGTLLR